MKKLFKVLAILIAVVMALLIIGTIALKIYLPPEKAKKMVLEKLSTQLKREVTLGSVSVSLLSGLQMTDLKISESPTFAQGTFLSSERFAVNIALVPLLFRKVIVKQITLIKPEVTVIRMADGKSFNFSDLTDSTKPAAPQSAPAPSQNAAPPFLFVVSRAEIQKGALHFIDKSPAKQTIDISPFDLKLKNVSLTSPFSVQLGMTAKSKGKDLKLQFAGDANLLNGTFTIKDGSLVSKETKVLISGNLSRLKTSDPAVDLTIDIPQLKLAELAPFVTLPPNVKIDKPIKGHVAINGDQMKMDLQSKLSLGSLELTSKGYVKNATSNQPVISLHTETNSFPIEEVLSYAPGSVPPGISLKGNTRIAADVSGTAAQAQFDAKVDGKDLVITQGDTFAKPAGVPLGATVIGTAVGSNKVFFKNITAHIGANQLTGSGSYETQGKQAVVNLTAKGSNWAIEDLAKLSPLVAPYKPTGTLSFELRANGPAAAPQTSIQTAADIAMGVIKHEFYEGKDLQMKWNLTQITQDLSKVTGTAALKQGPGKILNVEKLAASSRIGRIALAPLETLAKLQKKGALKQVNLPSLDSVPFDSLVGDYVLRSGTMDMKTFDLNGKDLTVQNRGTVGLAGAQPINMNVTMKFAEGAVGGSLGNILQDESGRPTVKFIATGSVSNPQVKWDTQEVQKKAVQEILKNKEVQKGLGELEKSLKGIFNK